MAENEIKFVGDSASVEKAQERVVAGQEKIEKAIAKSVKTSTEGAKEDARLKREAEKLNRALETSEERRARKLAEYERMHKAGLITTEKHVRAVAQLNSEFDQVGDSVEDLGETSTSAFAGMMSGIGGAIGAVFSLKKALELLNAEYEKSLSLQERSKNSAITYQQAMQDLRQNFSPDESLGWEGLDREVMRIAQASGVSTTVAAQSLGGALSTKGDKSNAWAVDATLAALQITRNPADAAALAESTGDYSRFGESQDQKAIQGFLGEAQKASIIKSVPQLSRQSVAAVAAGAELGLSTEEAMELFATVGNLSNDKTGEQTKTAMVTFFEQVGRSFKIDSTQRKDTELSGLYDQFMALPQDYHQRMDFLQSNPKLKDAFISKMQGGAAAGVALRGLLNNDEKWQREYGNVTAQVPSLNAANDAANRQSFDETARHVRGLDTPQGRIADAEARAKVNEEIQNLLRSSIEGGIGEMRTIFDDAIKNNNLKGPDSVVDFARNLSLRIREQFQNEEDAILDEMKGIRTYVKPEDQPTFDLQLQEVEKLQNSVKGYRGEIPDPLPITPPAPLPRQKEGIDFEDARSRPGFENSPKTNDRGAYEGTVREVSSTVTPQALETALAAAVKPLIQEVKNQSIRSQQQNAQLMNQQTAAIARNRPEKQSPLAKMSRENRGGYA